jgi:hypothetical protein
MGSGVTRVVAQTVLISLNDMFNAANMPGLQQKYKMLKNLYGDFMGFTADKSDRHIWRKKTLRHAGWLLTSEVNFGHDYPARNFVMWLKWLTWVQTLKDADATVNINATAVTGVPPAKAILDTLKAALEDVAQSPVTFAWAEKTTGLMTVSVDQRPGHYAVAIESIQATGIVGHPDNEEDSNLP